MKASTKQFKPPFKLRWLLIIPTLVYLFFTFGGTITVTPYMNGDYMAVHQNFSGDTVKVEICIDKEMSMCDEVTK